MTALQIADAECANWRRPEAVGRAAVNGKPFGERNALVTRLPGKFYQRQNRAHRAGNEGEDFCALALARMMAWMKQ